MSGGGGEKQTTSRYSSALSTILHHVSGSDTYIMRWRPVGFVPNPLSFITYLYKQEAARNLTVGVCQDLVGFDVFSQQSKDCH